MAIDVKGHSGCQIEVLRIDGEMFVYKSTDNPQYFDRLIKQAEKQKNASMKEYRHIRVPRIHGVDCPEGSVRVKMDYIYSRNFVEFIEHAGFEQIRYLIDALILFIEREIKESALTIVGNDILIKKFEDVMERTCSNPALKDDNEVKELLINSSEIFRNVGDMELPVGTCHGDLTFSNILFNGNNYYLIDFLDSFVESPLLDIVKLRQDTKWLWSRLMYKKTCDTIRLKIAFGKIDHEIDKYFSRLYSWYREFYAPFQLMNFHRILQYAKEPLVIDYLKKSISEQQQSF